MKIVLTGSIGHIGLPLTKQLVAQGHDVTVITSTQERVAQIKSLGASAAVGTIQDEAFLSETFTGADAVYLMITGIMESATSFLESGKRQAEIYFNAVKKAGVTNIVNLSSVGADGGKETGSLYIYHLIESTLSQLTDVSLTFLRPTALYYNLFSNLSSIKQDHAIYSGLDKNHLQVWVAPQDIAIIAAEALTQPVMGKRVQYVASDEVTGEEIAKVLGAAIDIPDLHWITITEQQQLTNLKAAGLSTETANLMVQMNQAQQEKPFYQDYQAHHPILGSVKLADFAREFAQVYQAQIEHD